MSSAARSISHSHPAASAAASRFRSRPRATFTRSTSASDRLARDHLTDGCDKLRLADRFLQDGVDLVRRQRNDLVASGHDDADALISQMVDQVAGQLAIAE